MPRLPSTIQLPYLVLLAVSFALLMAKILSCSAIRQSEQAITLPVDGDKRPGGAANGDEASEKTFLSTEPPPGPPQRNFYKSKHALVLISVKQTVIPEDLLKDSCKVIFVFSLKPASSNAMSLIGLSYYPESL